MLTIFPYRHDGLWVFDDDSDEYSDGGADCLDDLAWNGPFGDCTTYADESQNAGYCEYDEACEPCGCTCAQECGATGSGAGSGSADGYMDGGYAYMVSCCI